MSKGFYSLATNHSHLSKTRVSRFSLPTNKYPDFHSLGFPIKIIDIVMAAARNGLALLLVLSLLLSCARGHADDMSACVEKCMDDADECAVNCKDGSNDSNTHWGCTKSCIAANKICVEHCGRFVGGDDDDDD
ncbi:hypothetical protein ACLOJK_040381 [Asimina triloba]